MTYTEWLSKEQPETGNGCFKTPNEIKCEDKFCNGNECKKFLEYRLRFLNETLTTSTGKRKEHILISIDKCQEKLLKINESKM